MQQQLHIYRFSVTDSTQIAILDKSILVGVCSTIGSCVGIGPNRRWRDRNSFILVSFKPPGVTENRVVSSPTSMHVTCVRNAPWWWWSASPCPFFRGHSLIQRQLRPPNFSPFAAPRLVVVGSSTFTTSTKYPPLLYSYILVRPAVL